MFGRTRDAREERRGRAARHGAHASRGPWMFPLLVALLGLALARVAISVALFVVVPLVLTVLSLVFGKALRNAAAAVTRGGRRAYAAIDEEARSLGEETEHGSDKNEGAHVRVDGQPSPSDGARVRISEHELDDEESESDEESEGAKRTGRRGSA